MLIDTDTKATPCFCIRPITEVPEHRLAEFYERIYPQRAKFLKANWRWLYRVDEFDRWPVPLVAMVADHVIAHLGTTPVMLCRGEDVRWATWNADFAVVPEYRRQKAGTKLMQAMMMQWPLQIAFGNEKSVAAMLKIGWKVQTHTWSFQLLARPEYHPKIRQSPLALLGQMGGMVTRAVWAMRTQAARAISASQVSAGNLARFSRPIPDDALAATRSPEFLSWRVLAHPTMSEHYILNCSVDATAEYMLLARVSEQDGFRRLHLLSLIADPLDEELLSRCFASVVQWSLKTGIHRILFVTSNPVIAKVARSWFPISGSLSFLYYANDDSGWDYLSSSAHRWECLDSDFDLSV